MIVCGWVSVGGGGRGGGVEFCRVNSCALPARSVSSGQLGLRSYKSVLSWDVALAKRLCMCLSPTERPAIPCPFGGP
jgi:hypothetical protein